MLINRYEKPNSHDRLGTINKKKILDPCKDMHSSFFIIINIWTFLFSQTNCPFLKANTFISLLEVACSFITFAENNITVK